MNTGVFRPVAKYAPQTAVKLRPALPVRSELVQTAISMFAIPAALLLAWAFTPFDVAPAGALRLPALILIIGLLTRPVVDLLIGGLTRAFRAEHIALFSVVYFILLDPLQGLYDLDVARRTVFYECGAIMLFAFMVNIGASFRPHRVPGVLMRVGARSYSPNALFRIAVICFCIAMFNFAYSCDFSPSTMLWGLQQPRFTAPWSRGWLGSWNAFSDFLTNFGYVLPSFTVLIALALKKWSHWMVIASGTMAGIFLMFVAQDGGRRLPGVMIGAAIFTLLYHQRHRVRLTHALLIMVALLGTVVGMDYMLTTRNAGLGNKQFSGISALRVDDNFLRLGQTIEIIPEDHPFVGFQWLYYVIVRPIPRVFWPSKPTSDGFDLAGFLGVKDTSYSKSVIGDWYAAFGWIGIIVGGLFLGWLARNWSQLLDVCSTNTAASLYGVGAMAIFLSMRALIELILMSYPLLCWLAVDRLLYRYKARRAMRQRFERAVS